MRYNAKTVLYKYLDTVGDGTGQKNAVGNYLANPTIFKIQPPVGKNYHITTIHWHVHPCKKNPTDIEYGNLPELTNGIRVVVANNDGIMLDLTNGSPIKSNNHFYDSMTNVEIKEFQTNQTLSASWVFGNEELGIVLHGNFYERLEVRLSDNFTGLTNHKFLVKGDID